MALNSLAYWRISYRWSWAVVLALVVDSKHFFIPNILLLLSRYVDLSVQSKTPTILLSEKLLHHQSSVRFYNTLDHSYTNASIETMSWQPLFLTLSSAGTAWTVKALCVWLFGHLFYLLVKYSYRRMWIWLHKSNYECSIQKHGLLLQYFITNKYYA